MDEKINVRCPVCGTDFLLEDEVEEGDIVNCTECDSELEVDRLNPPELIVVKYEDFGEELEDEDWDEETWEGEEELEEEEEF